MNKYKIEVSERLSKIIEIQAKTDFEAMKKAKEIYEEGEIILGKGDLEDTYFEIIEAKEIQINKYETVCILNKDTKLQDIDSIVQFIRGKFKIDSIDYMGIKKLAYEIRGQKEGHYLLTNISGEYEKITELEKYYRQNENVIKFMTVKYE